jgi:putative phosphoesterase
MRIGVISDTHGLVRDEAVAAFRGSDVILHAGDVGSSDVLKALAAIAPVHAVRGNVDRDDWADVLPKTAPPWWRDAASIFFTTSPNLISIPLPRAATPSSSDIRTSR